MKTERRDFLRKAYHASVVAALAPMVAPQEIYAATGPSGEYKALVYIMLEGGNDAWNMVLPTLRQSDLSAVDYPGSYDNYAANRGPGLSVLYNDLSPALSSKLVDGKLDFSTGNPYPANTDTNPTYLSGMYHTDTGLAVNAVMPELAQMMNDGKVAAIASVGTLIEPAMDAENKKIPDSTIPGFMGSHNTQRRYQEMGQASNVTTKGWIGRLFDEWGTLNGSDMMGKNISFADNNYSLNGVNTSPLVMSTIPNAYKGEIRSVYVDGEWQDIDTLSEEEVAVRKNMASEATQKPFEDFFNRMVGRSFDLDNQIKGIWDNAHQFSATNSYGVPLFSEPELQLYIGKHLDTSLFKQLEAILKMIEYGKNNGMTRQVFYVRFGVFDTHSDHIMRNTALLRELSMGLYDFQNALEELGAADNVTTFTLSDFGRSLGDNGDGTDHAWAGLNLVLGNAVNGGLYGEFPDWTMGGKQDYKMNGTFVPTLSVEQQLATITKWFGADDAMNDILFPNLKNFNERDLGFMKA